MTKLHEVLAAEKTINAAWNTLLTETEKKFNQDHFFNGQIKSLKMLEDTPANQALEAAAAENAPVRTSVHDTLDYALGIFVNAEKLQLQKNVTNQTAVADVTFRGRTLFPKLPVDQLLGLEARLAKVRALFVAVPTLDASKNWNWDANQALWVSTPESTVKTEKIMVPVILAPATDKHPAQVKESTKDNTIGMFTLIKRSAAATAVQKANAIQLIDELLTEVKQARMRANEAEVKVDSSMMDELKNVLMSPFKN